MNNIERNYRIIQQRMIEQMEKSISLGRKIIDTELDTGLLNFIIRPIIKTFYDWWAQNEARAGTLEQIKITLDSGKILLYNGELDQIFDKIVEENFPKYFAKDQTSQQCSHTHKNYEKLRKLVKETFINYLKRVVKLLEVTDDIVDYGDLCRAAFKTKESAEENLMTQLSFTEKAIEIIENDPSILKIPMGKKILIKALRKGFEQTKFEFKNALVDTYNKK